MRLWASFLNNSSSRWEPIWENWPLHLELMDIVSPIYRSDFQRQGLTLLETSVAPSGRTVQAHDGLSCTSHCYSMPAVSTAMVLGVGRTVGRDLSYTVPWKPH